MRNDMIRFSRKQRQVLTWWRQNRWQAIICDGAVRSGKTFCMGLSFFLWAQSCFDGRQFALCGKTVGALRRNLLTELVPCLRRIGMIVRENRSANSLTVEFGGQRNQFLLFGGKDESSAALIQGKRCEEVFPYIPFAACLRARQTLPAKVIKVNSVNLSVEVVPVIRQNACIGAFALLQRFNDVEVRQNELRGQLLHKGYYAKYSFDDVIGQSAAIRRTKETLTRMANSESPVLLIGETGTGKELFAHAVHRASRRAAGPFLAINVAAFPENLLESELFGYEEGAFTGAKKGGRPGLFELAHRGTLFLDEVEGMSPALQIKLLRTLQEREVMRVGGNRIIHVDVRIVAATNEALERKVREGTFRRDLYSRLNTLPAVIPPLTERGDDMFLLMDQFRRELNGDFRLTEPVQDFFRRHTWPGNIRELRNVVEYFIYTDHRDITMEDLPPTLLLSGDALSRPASAPAAQQDAPAPSMSDSFRFVLAQLYAASEAGTPMGRDKLLQKARESHVPLSQQEVRTILTEMAEQGLARVSRGRGGSQLTPKGRELWEIGQR